MSKQPEENAKSFKPLIIDPAFVRELLPGLLVMKERAIDQCQLELQVVMKFQPLIFDQDIGKLLKLDEKERSVLYPLWERLCNQEEERMRNQLADFEDQKQEIFEMQQRFSDVSGEK